MDVLARKTQPGEFWDRRDFDHLLVDAKNVTELDFLVSSLEEQGWVERSINSSEASRTPDRRGMGKDRFGRS